MHGQFVNCLIRFRQGDYGMEYSKRKRLRLEEYDYSTPGAYFITICTHERRCILSDIIVEADALDGPHVALSSAGRIVEKYILTTDYIPGIHVEKYVIMPNHVHMLLLVGACYGPPRASAPTMATVPNAVSALKRLVNRELGVNIWQRSYHDHHSHPQRQRLSGNLELYGHKSLEVAGRLFL